VLSQPHIAIAVAAILALGAVGVIFLSWRILKRMRRWWSEL
jgi:hypothetical protein